MKVLPTFETALIIFMNFTVGERPLMMSNIWVGRGVQSKMGRYRVGQGR